MGDLEEHVSNGAPPEISSEDGSPQVVTSDRPGHPNADPNLAYVWLYTAIGIPLVILGIRDGWAYLFRSGDAAAFMVGAIVGALVENIIELSPDKFTLLKKVFAGLRASRPRPEGGKLVNTAVLVIKYYIIAILLSYYVFAMLFLVWNIIFSFSDLTVHHPTVDWVQIVVFFSPLCLLPIIRFIFTAQSPFPLRQMEHFVANRVGSQR